MNELKVFVGVAHVVIDVAVKVWLVYMVIKLKRRLDRHELIIEDVDEDPLKNWPKNDRA